MTEYEESPGVISMMRVGVAIAMRAGAVLVSASAVLAVAMVATGRDAMGATALGLAASGAGLIAGALGAKGWQAQAEARNER